MRAWRRIGLGLFLVFGGAGRAAGQKYAGWTVGDRWHGYGTILRTTDSGNTWARQGTGQVASVKLSGVYAVDPLTAWVVGEAYDGYATIYCTTNGGSAWMRKGSSNLASPDYLPNLELGKVHAYGDNVWAVGDGAILHSGDGGATWANRAPTGYESVWMQGVFAVDDTRVWVTGKPKDGYATILMSTNAGQTWARQSGGDVALADHLLGVSAVDADTAWAVGGAPDEGGYIALHTANGGGTWEHQAGVAGVQDANEVYAVNATSVWVAVDHGIFWSNDGGASWDNSSNHGHVTALATMGISAVNDLSAWSVVTSGGAGAIWHTPDGGTNWVEQGIPGETLPGLWTVSMAMQPIPEPSTLLLCLVSCGTGALWLRRRRRLRRPGPPWPE